MCVFNDCENCELDRKTVSLNSLKIKLSIDDGGGGKIQRTTQLRECSKICLPCPSLSYFCFMFNYCAAKVVIIFIYGFQDGWNQEPGWLDTPLRTHAGLRCASPDGLVKRGIALFSIDMNALRATGHHA